MFHTGLVAVRIQVFLVVCQHRHQLKRLRCSRCECKLHVDSRPFCIPSTAGRPAIAESLGCFRQQRPHLSGTLQEAEEGFLSSRRPSRAKRIPRARHFRLLKCAALYGGNLQVLLGKVLLRLGLKSALYGQNNPLVSSGVRPSPGETRCGQSSAQHLQPSRRGGLNS